MKAAERSVSSVMKSEFASVGPKDRLDLVDDVMKLGQVRHMPVLDDGRLVGVLSHRDLVGASLTRALDFELTQRRAFMRAVEVSEVMRRDPITVGPDDSLRDAAELVLEHKIGCLLVVDPEGSVLGLLTETDLLAAAYRDEAED